MLKQRPSLAMMAALAVSLAGGASLPAAPAPSQRRKPVTAPPRNVSGPDKRTALQREIAEWNAAVGRRKAEKKLRRNG